MPEIRVCASVARLLQYPNTCPGQLPGPARTKMTVSISMDDIPQPAAAVIPTIEAVIARGKGLLLVGAPGISGTMVARRIPLLIPPVTAHCARWLGAEYDAAGLGVRMNDGEWTDRAVPFRAPHHSCSEEAIIGSDRYAGEARLARFGVLMLDEVTGFYLPTLYRLKFARIAMGATAPTVVATTTGCPCGAWFGTWRCECSLGARRRHSSHIAKVADLLNLSRVDLPPITLADMRAHSEQRAKELAGV